MNNANVDRSRPRASSPCGAWTHKQEIMGRVGVDCRDPKLNTHTNRNSFSPGAIRKGTEYITRTQWGVAQR